MKTNETAAVAAALKGKIAALQDEEDRIAEPFQARIDAERDAMSAALSGVRERQEAVHAEIAEAAIEHGLPERVHLYHVDRDEELTDDQIATLVSGHEAGTYGDMAFYGLHEVEDDVHEWTWESRNDMARWYARKAVERIGFDPEVLDPDAMSMIEDAVYDRDDSDPVKDMAARVCHKAYRVETWGGTYVVWIDGETAYRFAEGICRGNRMAIVGHGMRYDDEGGEGWIERTVTLTADDLSSADVRRAAYWYAEDCNGMEAFDMDTPEYETAAVAAALHGMAAA